MGILIGLLWVAICVVMFLLFAVVLLQEGKGGGLAEAFGGVGAETFGVKATGINRFTAILGGLFLLLAVLINLAIQWEREQSLTPAAPEGPPTAVESPQSSAGDTTATPPVPQAGEE
jgi:preprotein translocase subunit SecG